ncbi:probable xyloglucan 6-xylosyltransferase 5 [Spinacia oleracea]|uniref:Probable xyloglucan 6-xylosyltransferase 5 n=1 Tax=Spinacia oleracea TaxID=3562 RepID=A0A9R0K7N8_SPIOL|nr:probable xyloglucan 6-xylosyltransferase 5 [Spinacia oleracea]
MGHNDSMNGKPTRGRQTQKTISNIRITILCGLITILVLRGTIGIGDLTGFLSEAEDQDLVKETNRILAEIRSDKDLSDPDDQNELHFNPNVTYTLGPKIDNWDTQRWKWLEQNPDFPNIVGGKGRVLLVTGSPPNPCDNSIGDHYLLKGVKNKIDYCRLHGIEIMYNMAHLDKEMAGYWAKLPLIRKLMLSHPEVEWIWWLDSDALFTDMVFEVPLEKYKEHNLVIHGYPDLLFEQKSWIALNTGSFLLRNSQWSLDLLDIWAPMGPKGVVRDEAGKLLTANLKGRPAFEADDQSALIYLLISQKEKWMNKVFVENSYYLHGFWLGLVDKYEEMAEKYHPGLGDERWPFVTHFVGCKPCGSYGDYPAEKCLKSMERAFNFADNQVLKLYGFRHKGLLSPNIKRFRNETDKPLKIVDELDIRRHIVAGSSKLLVHHFRLMKTDLYPV